MSDKINLDQLSSDIKLTTGELETFRENETNRSIKQWAFMLIAAIALLLALLILVDALGWTRPEYSATQAWHALDIILGAAVGFALSARDTRTSGKGK